MSRLTRVQRQACTRAPVLAAARQEFIEQAYALAKVDQIAATGAADPGRRRSSTTSRAAPCRHRSPGWTRCYWPSGWRAARRTESPDLAFCLRRVFPSEVWRHFRLVIDDAAVAATAVGLTDTNDRTEAAVRIQDGAIVARAQGRGAAHAAATANTAHAPRSRKAGT
ncbi:hypothetical protein [Nonomuraea sp. LPB2021202275-12-8]|uniref:hypothetical protein n=1 Tax=Nonomuraea sp. LPB2021202275-12-8 TaxID=3120159 RepID=UPI00300C88CB